MGLWVLYPFWEIKALSPCRGTLQETAHIKFYNTSWIYTAYEIRSGSIIFLNMHWKNWTFPHYSETWIVPEYILNSGTIQCIFSKFLKFQFKFQDISQFFEVHKCFCRINANISLLMENETIWWHDHWIYNLCLLRCTQMLCWMPMSTESLHHVVTQWLIYWVIFQNICKVFALTNI